MRAPSGKRCAVRQVLKQGRVGSRQVFGFGQADLVAAQTEGGPGHMHAVTTDPAKEAQRRQFATPATAMAQRRRPRLVVLQWS